MKKLHWLLILILGLGLLVGCGEDNDPEQADGEPAVSIWAIAGNGQIMLEWDGEVGELYTEFKVYNVDADTPESELPNPLVTTTTNSYTVSGLNNANVYEFHVRTTHKDGDVVEPTNTAENSPRPEGTGMIIYEFAYADHASAFDFSAGQAISMIFANKASIDLYLGTGTTQNGDPTTAELTIKSPHLVQSANNWGDRVTGISGKGAGQLDDFDTAEVANNSYAAAITQGNVYHVKIVETVDGQVHYAKLRITAVSGTAGQRQISFEYAYQDNPNYARF